MVAQTFKRIRRIGDRCYFSNISFKKWCLSLIISCLYVSPVFSATYFVRLDGGTATQCSGLVDAAYSGTGVDQPCAFVHPFWAISPVGRNPTKMVGGDTLIIDGSNNAEYMIGYGAPNTKDTTKCHSAWPYGCYMRAIPSGSDPSNPTRVLGKGWDQGCASPPQLWGTERVSTILNLEGSSNIEVQCLEVTDHSNCQEHGPNSCNRNSFPYGQWGQNGLKARDSENVLLKNVNIHGMAYRGVFAGRLRDWVVEDSKIVANSFVGWDGDIDGSDYNTGTMTFIRTDVQFNGCGETYPDSQPYNCYSQDQGGYGDGFGTGFTGGDWNFFDCDISHNASDGLDLLYHDNSGMITVKRSRFEGNAGNQIKVSTNVSVSDSVILSNCGYFANNSITWKSNGFNHCRAGGDAIAIAAQEGNGWKFYNNTIYSQGNSLVLVVDNVKTCNGTENFIARNNIYFGAPYFNTPSVQSSLHADLRVGGCSTPIDINYSLIYEVKDSLCPKGSNNLCSMNPQFTGPFTGDEWGVSLKSTSPVIGKALVLTGKSSLDYQGNERGDVWDIGALEYDIVEPDPEPELEPEPDPEPTCADEIQYCTNKGQCKGRGYYWYDNTCNVSPEPEPKSTEDDSKMESDLQKDKPNNSNKKKNEEDPVKLSPSQARINNGQESGINEKRNNTPGTKSSPVNNGKRSSVSSVSSSSSSSNERSRKLIGRGGFVSPRTSKKSGRDALGVDVSAGEVSNRRLSEKDLSIQSELSGIVEGIDARNKKLSENKNVFSDPDLDGETYSELKNKLSNPVEGTLTEKTGIEILNKKHGEDGGAQSEGVEVSVETDGIEKTVGLLEKGNNTELTWKQKIVNIFKSMRKKFFGF